MKDGVKYCIAARDLECPSRDRLAKEAQQRQQAYKNETSGPVDLEAEEARYQKYKAQVEADGIILPRKETEEEAHARRVAEFLKSQ